MMYSLSLLHTIPRVTTVEEKDNGMLREKGYHTPAKRKIQHLKHQHRIIKLTQNAFFFTLTHYDANHDRGRKNIGLLQEKSNHTPAKRKTTIK